MQPVQQLEQTLRRMDGRGYKAYKAIEGAYRFQGGELHVDHVQGDPFAAPSKLRLRLPRAVVGLPGDLLAPFPRRLALEDLLARRLRGAIAGAAISRQGSGKSGLVLIDAGQQEVLERTAVRAGEDRVEARLQVGLPAAGRRVLGRQAAEILCRQLPALALEALVWSAEGDAVGRRFVACVENQFELRRQLAQRELVAFVADGAILPRQSGVSDAPLGAEQAVPFRAPSSMSVTLQLPSTAAQAVGLAPGQVSGMGIPVGVTLIVGGGYHGKSTLLRALERAVYPHVPGDGRELVVTVPDAVKIRAEDRRRVEGVDISPFITDLPGGRATDDFRTEEASGSTSQAANIMEALESGARCLLIDEDTSAANAMIRDARMQRLVSREHEPITPLVDRIRQLHRERDVSTIVVMGGSGDYFDQADTVIMMRDHLPHEVTAEARQVAAAHPSGRLAEVVTPLPTPLPRIPLPGSLDASRGRKPVKIDAPAHDAIRFGEHDIDLRAVEQLVDRSQALAVGHALHLLAQRLLPGAGRSVAQLLDELDAVLDAEGLEVLAPFRRGDEHPGNFARPRRHEIAAALNRLRTLWVRRQP